MVVWDVFKALAGSKLEIPARLGGMVTEFAVDKGYSAYDVYNDVTGDMRIRAERIGQNIEKIRQFWKVGE